MKRTILLAVALALVISCAGPIGGSKVIRNVTILEDDAIQKAEWVAAQMEAQRDKWLKLESERTMGKINDNFRASIGTYFKVSGEQGTPLSPEDVLKVSQVWLANIVEVQSDLEKDYSDWTFQAILVREAAKNSKRINEIWMTDVEAREDLEKFALQEMSKIPVAFFVGQALKAAQGVPTETTPPPPPGEDIIEEIIEGPPPIPVVTGGVQ